MYLSRIEGERRISMADVVVVVVMVRLLSQCSPLFLTVLESWGSDVLYVQVQRVRMAWLIIPVSACHYLEICSALTSCSGDRYSY